MKVFLLPLSKQVGRCSGCILHCGLDCDMFLVLL